MKYVLVGNSYSAVWAAEAIRRVDADGEVFMISAEKFRPYAKALLQDYVSMRFTEHHMYYRGEHWYERMKVKPGLGSPVVEVNDVAKIVVLESGEKFTYDRLLIATGGVPFVPPIKGVDECRDVYTFTTWGDAMRIKDRVDAGEVRSAVVIGAGLIGTQCAEGLAARGVKVTIVELENQVLPRAVDSKVAGWIEEEFHKEGISVRLSDTVEEVISADGRLKSVKLKSGDVLEPDILVVAIGVRPNVDFLRSSSVKVDRGVLVDEHMRTSVEDVFAAGDVAQAPEVLTGEKQVIPIIPVATEQGKIAGFNMAGKSRTYPGALSMNSFHFGELEIISAGKLTPEEGDEVITYVEEEKRLYKKFIVSGGRLAGYVLTRDVENAGVYTALIRNRVELGDMVHALSESRFHFHKFPEKLRKSLLEVRA